MNILNEIQGMTVVNCTVDKLLALALVTDYMTDYSIIIIFGY